MTVTPDLSRARLGVRRVDEPPFQWAVPPLAAGCAALLTVIQPMVARVIGVVSWSGCFCEERAGTWPVGITVMVWHAAFAVVFGALIARAIANRTERSWSELLKAVLSAAGGSIFALPIVASLAGRTKVEGVTSPGLQLGLAIPAGALLGIGLGLLVLRLPILAPAVWTHFTWIWGLGFISVVLSWGDEVRQTVPLGAAYIGGPGKNAAAIDHTVYDSLVGVLKLVSFLGPVIIAGVLTWFVLRAGSRPGLAVLAGAIGPSIVLSAYLSRSDALTGDNTQWFSLSASAFLLACAVSIGTVLFAVMWRRRPVEDKSGPVIAVHLTPERKTAPADSYQQDLPTQKLTDRL